MADNPFKGFADYGPWAAAGLLLILIGAGLTGWASFSALSALQPAQLLGIVLCATGALLLFCQVHILTEKKKERDPLQELDRDTWGRLISCLKDHRAVYHSIEFERADRIYNSLSGLRGKLATMLASSKSGSSVVPVIRQVQDAIRDFDGAIAEVDRHIRKMVELQLNHDGSKDYLDRYGQLYGPGPSQKHFPDGIANITEIYPRVFEWVFLLALGSLRGKVDFILNEYNRLQNLNDDLTIFDTGASVGKIFE